MKLNDAVGLVLKNKGSRVHSIPPDVTVYEALQKMADENVGALVVIEGTELVGLISERDYARKVILKDRSSKEMKVHEIMSSPVVTVNLRTTIDECMYRMTDKRCRHLPVVEEGQVVGVVSIGDLVNWIMTAQDQTIHQLEDYITGKYPGRSARRTDAREVVATAGRKMASLAGQTAFYYLAAASIATAILAVTRRNPIHSMLWVLALFLHVAGIFLLVGAEFLAAVQVIVYAGAILVFYLFFLMLLDMPNEVAGPRFGAHWPLVRRRGAGVRGPGVVRERFGAGAGCARPPATRRRFDREPLGHRNGPLHRVRAAFRDRLPHPLGRHRGRGRRRQEKDPLLMVPVGAYLGLSAVLFGIGLIGFLGRRNIILMLVSVEIMLNAVNVSLAAFSHRLQDSRGQILALFVIAVAAAEVAVGLGLVLALSRNKPGVSVEDLTELKW